MAGDENVVEFVNSLMDDLDAHPQLIPDGDRWCYKWSGVFDGLFDVEVTSPRRKIVVAVTVSSGSDPAPKDVKGFFRWAVWPRRGRITEFTFKGYSVPLVSQKREIERYLVRVLNEG